MIKEDVFAEVKVPELVNALRVGNPSSDDFLRHTVLKAPYI
jgi:hypothetical protein